MAQEVIFLVKFIAAVLEVPNYVACEHILQVGSYRILTVYVVSNNGTKGASEIVDAL
jgi:hypothetical protein